MANELKMDIANRLRALTPDQRALLLKLASDRVNHDKELVELRSLPRSTNQGPQEFPVSFSQQRLWLLDQLSPDVALYNIPLLVPIRGRISRDVVGRALNDLICRHESLRTSFQNRGGEVLQIVHPPAEMILEYSDVTDVPEPKRSEEVNRIAALERAHRFELQQPPLLRARLIRLQPDGHLLVATVHHIIFDGWSAGLFLQELSASYQAAASGSPNPSRPLAYQYSDYSVWQQKWVGSAAAKEHMEYWSRQLLDLPVLALPTDRPRPAVSSFRGDTLVFPLHHDVTRAAREYSRCEGATLFMTFLAAFACVLARYARQDDIPIGTYSVGRSRPELEPIIGCFLNTIVLRVRLQQNSTFSELVRQVRQMCLDAYANQEVPFEMVLPSLGKDRGNSLPFSVTFQYLNLPTLPASPMEAQNSALTPTRRVAAFDLAVTLSESAGDLVVQMEYSTDLFDRSTIETLAAHYERLIASAVANPLQRLWTLPMMCDAEIRQVLHDFNDTVHPIAPTSIATLFEAQAQHAPDAIAFVEDNRRVTYREMQCTVNRIANYLTECNLTATVRIGVLMPRSIDAVTTILAIFKIGAVYVPLDPAYPPDRLKLMAQDADLHLILALKSTSSVAGFAGCRAICIEEILSSTAALSDDAAPVPTDPERTAYILFTSGSTGRPKGVIACESQILNRLQWMWSEYPFAPGEVACHKTALSFIDSLWEIFGGLLVGTATVIVGNDELKDLDRFLHTLRKHHVTRIWLVPSLLQTMVDSYPDLASRVPNLNFWVSSGEFLSAELYRRFVASMPGATLYNLYGTSEVWDVTWHTPNASTEDDVSVPIGKPIWNMRTYVLDAHGSPQPPSVWGELCVAGLGVGVGYINSAERTAERFREDPFVPGERMYRTGDLARWRRNGTLEYLGRLDRQVKLRGHRIELEEVERTLGECRGVGTVAVVTAGGSRGGSLIAYVAPSGDHGASHQNLAARLRSHARQRLPEYMIPSRIVVRCELPLSPTGKVDRTALALMGEESRSQTSQFVAPANDTEKAIARIWAEVLELPRVSAEQDFFDLGGHSLAAMRAISRINQEFSADISLPLFFNASTVSQLASVIIEKSSTGASTAGCVRVAS